jgi:hypothetical protein
MAGITNYVRGHNPYNYFGMFMEAEDCRRSRAIIVPHLKGTAS